VHNLILLPRSAASDIFCRYFSLVPAASPSSALSYAIWAAIISPSLNFHVGHHAINQKRIFALDYCPGSPTWELRFSELRGIAQAAFNHGGGFTQQPSV
jgi:hypothetical protein